MLGIGERIFSKRGACPRSGSQTPRNDRLGRHRAVDTKLKAVADAARHRFPTADIDVMLREIESDYFNE